MTELTYEQPLNEKTRSYLRLEYLEQQLQLNLEQDHQHRCFYPLFSLCELAERCDYRGEVLNDLHKQIVLLSNSQNQSLQNASYPPVNGTQIHSDQIDSAQIEKYLIQLTGAREVLHGSIRPGSGLKQNRFLAALRQRFNMPGACCNFDLPQLHYWMAKPWDMRQQEYAQWIDHFMPLLTSIKLLLELTRLTSNYTQEIATAGFYQGNSGKHLSLIRVQIDADQGCYPTISGHKNRYAIHFVQFEPLKHCDNAVPFKLASCS